MLFRSTIEKTLESHIRRLEADKAALAANQRDRKNLDLEVQTQKQKISKLRDQMSQAKTNEQYRAFQHEIDYAEKEIGKLDDRGLELMAAAEPLDAAVKAAEASLKEEQKTVEAEKVKARQATSADQVELEKLRAEHKETFAKLPRTSQAAYERIRKKWKSTAASEVKDGRCTAGLEINKTNWANTFEKPPFEAYSVGCGITFTFGGLKIDTDTHVLDMEDAPIPGLYAAGELVGGLYYFNYPGSTGLMAGSIFGRIAGREAATHAKQ